MAEDLTGLDLPSKTLVKSFRRLYVADPIPVVLYTQPPPYRPPTGSTTGFSGGTVTGNPFAVEKPLPYPGTTIVLAPGATTTIGGVTYTAGKNGAYVHIYSNGQAQFVQK